MIQWVRFTPAVLSNWSGAIYAERKAAAAQVPRPRAQATEPKKKRPKRMTGSRAR